MRFDVVTIFPEYLAVLDVSLLGRARREGLVDVHVHEARAVTHAPPRARGGKLPAGEVYE